MTNFTVGQTVRIKAPGLHVGEVAIVKAVYPYYADVTVDRMKLTYELQDLEPLDTSEPSDAVARRGQEMTPTFWTTPNGQIDLTGKLMVFCGVYCWRCGGHQYFVDDKGTGVKPGEVKIWLPLNGWSETKNGWAHRECPPSEAPVFEDPARGQEA